MQFLQRDVPDFQLSTYRFTLQFLVCGLVLKLKGASPYFSNEKLPAVLIMCVGSLFYNVFFFASSAILPLAHAMACYSISAMFFIGFFTKVLLKKDLGFGHGLSLMLSSLGIVFINQPWSTFTIGFLPPYMMTSITFPSTALHYGISNYTGIGTHEPNQLQRATISTIDLSIVIATGYGLSCLAGLSGAVYLLTVGTYLLDMNPFSQGFVVSVTNSVASLLISFYVEELAFVTKVSEILLVIIHCFGVTFDLICTSAATQRINPSHVCLIQSFTVVVLLIIQYTLMNNGLSGHENMLEVIGSIVIMSAIALTGLTSGFMKPHEDLP